MTYPAEYLITSKSHRCPMHPGVLLKEDILPALKLSVTEAARDLGVSRQSLSRILNKSHPITPPMALRLGRLCHNDPTLWLRLQQAHDLFKAQEKLGAELDKIPIYFGNQEDLYTPKPTL